MVSLILFSEIVSKNLSFGSRRLRLCVTTLPSYFETLLLGSLGALERCVIAISCTLFCNTINDKFLRFYVNIFHVECTLEFHLITISRVYTNRLAKRNIVASLCINIAIYFQVGLACAKQIYQL